MSNRPIQRINCHLYTDSLAVIDCIAEVMGASRASLIRDLMDQLMSHFEAIVDRLVALKVGADYSVIACAEQIAKVLDANLCKGVNLL